jgi:hypothetical protein
MIWQPVILRQFGLQSARIKCQKGNMINKIMQEINFDIFCFVYRNQYYQNKQEERKQQQAEKQNKKDKYVQLFLKK